MRPTKDGFFVELIKLDKLYKKIFYETTERYHFTPNEITVLLFLYNNAPDLDTATDIARCKGISKGLVAQSVDALCKKGYITATRDQKDRRVFHLGLNQTCDDIVAALDQCQQRFFDCLRKGVPDEDWACMMRTLKRMMENLNQYL